MEIKEIVRTAFDKEIKRIFGEKPELYNFIMKHERKNLCIDNLEKEIRLTELTHPRLLRRDNIEFLGTSYAKTFAKLAIDTKMNELNKYKFAKMKEEEAKAADATPELPEGVHEINRFTGKKIDPKTGQ